MTINKEFGDKGSQTAAPIPTIHVWCIPFEKSAESLLTNNLDVWLVSRKNHGRVEEYAAFGSHAGAMADKRDNRAFSVGTAIDRLTEKGQLTEAGWDYVMANGIQRDVESLKKWTLSRTPEHVKYTGFELAHAFK